MHALYSRIFGDVQPAADLEHLADAGLQPRLDRDVRESSGNASGDASANASKDGLLLHRRRDSAEPFDRAAGLEHQRGIRSEDTIGAARHQFPESRRVLSLHTHHARVPPDRFYPRRRVQIRDLLKLCRRRTALRPPHRLSCLVPVVLRGAGGAAGREVSVLLRQPKRIAIEAGHTQLGTEKRIVPRHDSRLRIAEHLRVVLTGVARAVAGSPCDRILGTPGSPDLLSRRRPVVLDRLHCVGGIQLRPRYLLLGLQKRRVQPPIQARGCFVRCCVMERAAERSAAPGVAADGAAK